MKVNPALMESVLHSRIARRMNAKFKLSAHVVSAAQVALVASGEDYTESHPVHAAIKSELRKYDEKRL